MERNEREKLTRIKVPKSEAKTAKSFRVLVLLPFSVSTMYT